LFDLNSNYYICFTNICCRTVLPCIMIYSPVVWKSWRFVVSCPKISPKYQLIYRLVAPDPPTKEGLVKLCTKSLALLEFGQLQSDCSISNLMMSHKSIKGFAAQMIIKNRGENGHKSQSFLFSTVETILYHQAFITFG